MPGEVVYNGHDTRVAPDIIFGVGDDTFQPLTDSSDLSPCHFLRDWTAADPTRLLKLILVIRLVTFFWNCYLTFFCIVHFMFCTVFCDCRLHFFGNVANLVLLSCYILLSF